MLRRNAGWGIALAVATAACGSGSNGGNSNRSDAGSNLHCGPVAAANAVDPNGPLGEGQFRFLCDAWGTEQLDTWPPADFMLALMKNEPAVFGNQFSKFGFIVDPNDKFPIGLKRGLVDPSKVHETCAMCHVAKLPDGRLWLGAPATHLDIGRFRVEVDKRWVAAGHPPMMNALERKKALGLGPGRTNAETLGYPKVVPADFPPYFNLSERTHLNYLGTGGNVRTEASLSIYTFGAGAPDDARAKVPFPSTAHLDAFLKFFGALSPPPPPTPSDPSLVAQGKQVFANAQCGSCHHIGDIGADQVTTLDQSPTGQDRLPGVDANYPKGSIHTDPLHFIIDLGSGGSGGGSNADAGTEAGADSGVDTGYADLIHFIISHGLQVSLTDGYAVLDLRGLWATAPYLHNGSVPTLDDLLKPASQRPVTWQRGSFTVDTTVPGNENIGHEFGTQLSSSDKTALVAYLKSL